MRALLILMMLASPATAEQRVEPSLSNPGVLVIRDSSGKRVGTVSTSTFGRTVIRDRSGKTKGTIRETSPYRYSTRKSGG